MNTERRSNRSRSRSLATRFYLLNVARRHQPRAIALTDLNGEVLAGVEGRPFMENGYIATRACERVERVITGLARGVIGGHGDRNRSWTDRVIQGFNRLRRRPTSKDFNLEGVKAIERITIDGNELLVVVIGDDSGDAIDDAIAGIERIYTGPKPTPETVHFESEEITMVEDIEEEHLIEDEESAEDAVVELEDITPTLH